MRAALSREADKFLKAQKERLEESAYETVEANAETRSDVRPGRTMAWEGRGIR